MRIDNTYLQNAEVPQQTKAGRAARSTAAHQAADTADTAGRPNDQSEHVPSPELQHYAALVQQEPEVRDDRLQAVAQRLRQGYYSTPASAQQTAAAILKAVD